MCLLKEALQRQGAARGVLGCSPFTPSLTPLKHCLQHPCTTSVHLMNRSALCVRVRGRRDTVPGKLGMLQMRLGLMCFKAHFSSSFLPPPLALRQQPRNMKANRPRFQSCDFSAAESVMRKIISKLNVRRFSEMLFNNIEL